MKKQMHPQSPTPLALYARAYSDRQNVDLSVAAQLRALKHYAEKNGYLVAREYVDEAETGCNADRLLEGIIGRVDEYHSEVLAQGIVG